MKKDIVIAGAKVSRIADGPPEHRSAQSQSGRYLRDALVDDQPGGHA